jgi:hypothetical protein
VAECLLSMREAPNSKHQSHNNNKREREKKEKKRKNLVQ